MTDAAGSINGRLQVRHLDHADIRLGAAIGKTDLKGFL